MKKAIVTVVGKDTVGIIHGVTGTLAENKINVLDISQTILDEMFTMMMVVDISASDMGIDGIAAILNETGKKIGVEIRIQLTDIFEAMHRI